MVGIRWFDETEKGMKQLAEDFGCAASQVGPNTTDPALQAQMAEDLIVRLEPNKSAITELPNDEKSLDPILKKANDKGIVTIGWESTNMENLTYDLEAVDNVKYGEDMMESLAQSMGGKGEYAIAVALLTIEVHCLWADSAVAYQKEHYPDMKCVTIPYVETANDTKQAYSLTQELIKAHPNLKGILACEGTLLSSAAQVVEEKNLIGKLMLTGLAIPSTVRNYIENGTIQSCSVPGIPANHSYCLGVVALAVLNGIEIQVGDYLGRPGWDIVTKDGKILTAHGNATITKDNINTPEMDF